MAIGEGDRGRDKQAGSRRTSHAHSRSEGLDLRTVGQRGACP